MQACEGILQACTDVATLAPNYSLETIVDAFSQILLGEKGQVSKNE